MRYTVQRGFALPTVVIASVVMLMILVTTVGAVTSARVSLDSQYVSLIKRDTTESAGERIYDCLLASNYIAQWTNVKPLKPETDCSGNVSTNPAAKTYVMSNGLTSSTYSVGAPVMTSQGIQTVSINTSIVVKRQSSGVVSRTYAETTPIKIGGNVTVNSVSFGYSNCGTFLVTMNGNGVARGVGANGCSQLGDGTTTDSTMPLDIQLPGAVSVNTSLSPSIFTNFLNSGYATGLVGTDDNAYFSGGNSYGQLGVGNTTPLRVFTEFTLPLTPAGNANVAAGQVQKAIYATPIFYANYVITDKGYVYSAGECTDGETGTNNSGVGCTVLTPTLLRTGATGLPWPNPSNPSTMPKSIAGDGGTRHVIMKDGSVYGWGYSAEWALGVNVSTAIVPIPTKVIFFGQTVCTKGATCPFGAGPSSGECTYGSTQNHCVLKVLSVMRSTYVILNDGTIWSTGGDNGWGMLGLGTTNANTGVFKQITAFPADGKSHLVTDAYADAYELVMLTADGTVYTVGRNVSGVAGCGTPVTGSTGACPTIITTPIRMILPGTVKAVSIYHTSNGSTFPKGSGTSYNTENTYVIGDDKKLYGTGSNDFGQLGNGCTITPTGPLGRCAGASVVGTPVVMNGFNGTNLIPVSVKSGRGTTIVITLSGVAYTVGLNDYGQLGDGTTNNSSTPKANRYTNSMTPLYF